MLIQSTASRVTFFFGEMNIAGGFLPKLTLNLSDPTDHWVMDGTMNLMGDPGIFLDRLAGSRMDSFGDVTRHLGPRAGHGGHAILVGIAHHRSCHRDSLDDRRDTRDTVRWKLDGQGTLRNGASGELTLGDMASLDEVRLGERRPTRHRKWGPGIASVDQFISSASATWAIDIGGYTAGR